MEILFSAGKDEWHAYEPHLEQAFRSHAIDATLLQETSRPETVDFVIWSPASPLQDFSSYTSLKAILSLWAGVDKVITNKTIKVPLCRMVDPGLTAGMVEWVVGHVMRYHLGMDRHILNQDGIWRHDDIPPLARDRHIGILGMGELGSAAALALAQLGFEVAGWTRREHKFDHATGYFGETGLPEILARSEILVVLLPLTKATDALLNRHRFDQVRRGAFLINAGRGQIIDDDALLAALGSGQVAHATLDVFRQEPLPPSHPFWGHPKITVSPHIASETRPKSAARSIARQIRRWLDGENLLHQVDLSNGY